MPHDIDHIVLGHGDLCEDALRVQRLPSGETLIALADGAGVGRGGDAAARLACDRAVDEMLAMGEKKRAKHGKAWERLIRRVDDAVYGAEGAGEATLVALAAHGGTVCGVSVGDSAAWIFGRGVDQDLTAQQRAAPLVGSGIAAGAPFQGTIPGPVAPGPGGKTSRGGGALIVVTDGVWRYVARDAVADAALHHSPRAAIERVEALARASLNGKLIDDLAMVVVRR